MKHHDVRPEAALELREAVGWYEQERLGLGADLLAEYQARLRVALETPASGAVVGVTEGGAVVRRFRLKRFARYAIVLVDFNATPTVIAFEHSSRRPKYWRGRVR